MSPVIAGRGLSRRILVPILGRCPFSIAAVLAIIAFIAFILRVLGIGFVHIIHDAVGGREFHLFFLFAAILFAIFFFQQCFLPGFLAAVGGDIIVCKSFCIARRIFCLWLCVCWRVCA